MDNQTLSIDVFGESLTKEQSDACERDEVELGRIFSEGWSEENAVRFHRAMLHARRVEPEVTVDALFEFALRIGLSFLGDEDVLARLVQDREDDVIVFGVQRRARKDAGRTACILSPDTADLAKLRRGKKRGVRVVGVPGNKHGSAGVSIGEA
jgi:hypothetical protein